MNRILMVGFEYMGLWHYARLAMIPKQDGHFLQITLLDRDLNLLLPGNETICTGNGFLLVKKSLNNMEEKLQDAIAKAIARMLHLEIKYVDTLSES